MARTKREIGLSREFQERSRQPSQKLKAEVQGPSSQRAVNRNVPGAGGWRTLRKPGLSVPLTPVPESSLPPLTPTLRLRLPRPGVKFPPTGSETQTALAAAAAEEEEGGSLGNTHYSSGVRRRSKDSGILEGEGVQMELRGGPGEGSEANQYLLLVMC